MSGTAKTTAALLAEQVDNTVGAVHEQQIRNLTVSGPQWDVVSAAAAPGILRGSVNLGDYIARNGGLLGTGLTLVQRQTNATQTQAAFDYAATNQKFLEFSPCSIEIDNTAGILCNNNNYAGFALYGSDENSVIYQYHTGSPIITFGDTSGSTVQHGMMFDGMRLVYSGGSSSSQICVSFGGAYGSTFKRLNVGGAGNAGYLFNWTTGTLFSCTFEDLWGSGAQTALFFWAGGGSGSTFKNIYLNNAPSGTPLACTTPFVYGNSATIDEATFQQLNVEHVQSTSIMNINGGSATFLDCHWENCQLTGATPSFWNLASNIGVVNIVGGKTLDMTYNTGLMSGTGRWFYIWDQTPVTITGHQIAHSGSPPLASNGQFQLFYQSSGVTPQVSIAPFTIHSLRIHERDYFGFMSIDSVLPRATFGDATYIEGYCSTDAYPRMTRSIIYDPPTNMLVYGAMGRSILVRYTQPLTGNLVLVLALPMMNTGSGSSTNRQTTDMVRVVRDSGATGAFTVTVRNATTGGTSLGTVAIGASLVASFNGTAWTTTV